MPLYEYECLGCQSRVERRQKFSDEPLRVCPTCGGDLRRLLHPAGIIFKGSGWYVTDSKPRPTESESSSSSSHTSSSSTSSSGTSSASSTSNGTSSNGSDSAKPAATSTSGGKS
jgi:putative FmdB family regulatory protein